MAAPVHEFPDLSWVWRLVEDESSRGQQADGKSTLAPAPTKNGESSDDSGVNSQNCSPERNRSSSGSPPELGQLSLETQPSSYVPFAPTIWSTQAGLGATAPIPSLTHNQAAAAAAVSLAPTQTQTAAAVSLAPVYTHSHGQFTQGLVPQEPRQMPIWTVPQHRTQHQPQPQQQHHYHHQHQRSAQPPPLFRAIPMLMTSEIYSRHARNLINCSSINVQPFSEKYWGMGGDSFTERLYVADRNTNEVAVVDPNVGMTVMRFGQIPVAYKSLFRPTGVAIDQFHRRILVCDKDNHRIAVYSMEGSLIMTFGKKGYGNGEFNYPWGIAVSPNGSHIAVSDSKNHRLQLFDQVGNYLNKFSVFETNPFEYKQIFDYPRGLVFDHEGKSIYVTDFNANTIGRLALDTWSYGIIAGGPGVFFRPQGIALDQVGNVLFCNSRKHALAVISPSGHVVTEISKVGTCPIYMPTDVAPLRHGKVAVLQINGKIHIF